MEKNIPQDLNPEEFRILKNCVENQNQTLAEVMVEAEEHVNSARRFREMSGFVNARLAEAILDRFQKIAAAWDTLDENSQKWCLGMIQYFTLNEDELDDFHSPLGFEDDAEVMNACLKLAGHENLCIRIEDYDAIE